MKIKINPDEEKIYSAREAMGEKPFYLVFNERARAAIPLPARTDTGYSTIDMAKAVVGQFLENYRGYGVEPGDIAILDRAREDPELKESWRMFLKYPRLDVFGRAVNITA